MKKVLLNNIVSDRIEKFYCEARNVLICYMSPVSSKNETYKGSRCT